MQNSSKNIINSILLLMAWALFLAFGIDMTTETLKKPEIIFVLIAIAIVCFVFRKNLTKDAVIWTMIGGVLVKTAYILYTAVWTRQHDVISFGAGEGHAAYIEYILNNKSLPNFDPRLVWSFFQPPLHHTVSAAWMWINVRLGIAQRQLEENVQILTLMYMCVLMIVTWLICKELAMKQRGMLIAMLIVAFHPIYTLLSGSINNDALSICLSGIAIYIAILWYKKPGFIYIILLAMAIGLAMSAKLSAGLVAPGIGAYMLYRLYADREHWKRYLLQFVCFGIVVFPLGLWWPIRNKILWDMPANYIPEVGEQLTHSDMISRVFDLRMTSPYAALINNGNAYDEYNVILAMIKTSLFGESDFGQVSACINPFAWILFVSSVIIIIMQIVAFIMIVCKKEAAPAVEDKILLGITAISLLGGYLMFALSYNNFSAQDFRYSALMISIMAIFLGLYDDRLDAVSKGKNCSEKQYKLIKILRSGILGMTIVFAVSSVAVYLLIGIM